MSTAAIFVTEQDERLELLASLPDKMPLNPFLRAALWFGEIEAVRNLVATFCAVPDSHVPSSLAAELLVKSWMQRLSPERSSSFSASRATSPQRLNPDEDSRCTTPSQESGSPLVQDSGSPSVQAPGSPLAQAPGLSKRSHPSGSSTRSRPSKAARYTGTLTPRQRRPTSGTTLARTRDNGSCVITKDGTLDVAHIYPFCLTDTRKPVYTRFWDTLVRFFPRANSRWALAVFPAGKYEDTGRNLLCFSPNAHRYHAAGYFGLRPIDISDDRTEVHVEFHWLDQSRAYLQDTRYIAVPPLSQPSHRSLPHTSGPNRSVLLDHTTFNHTTFRCVASGDIITIRTRDPETCPLPDLDILDLQWRMQLLVAASCAGLPPVSVSGVHPNVDGAGDEDVWYLDPQPFDVAELAQRLAGYTGLYDEEE